LRNRARDSRAAAELSRLVDLCSGVLVTAVQVSRQERRFARAVVGIGTSGLNLPDHLLFIVWGRGGHDDALTGRDE
jgi:hypothetical protein